jgi:adenylate kinase
VQNHTKLGAQVRRIVAAGLLVDDELVESVIRERLTTHDWNYGFVIDGFPRNGRQAEFFLESYDIDGVINLELPDSEVERRVLARRLCSGCGLDYNLIAHRPRDENVCDVCGAPLVVREDDNPEALAVRLSEYHAKTKPVIELFQRKEFVASIDATRSIPEIQAEIRVRFDLPPQR